MKSRIKNLNIFIFFAIMAFAMTCVIIPPTSDTSSASINDDYYKSKYNNEKVIYPSPDNGYTDNNSSYIKNLVSNPAALFNATYTKYKNATALYSTVSGTASANSPIGVIVQQVKNTKIINADGTRYSEAVSYSSNSKGVKVAEQVFARGNVVKYRNSNSVNSSLSVSYSNNWDGGIKTLSSYQNALGKELARISYAINDNTIQDVSSVRENADGTYSLTINFNASAGTYYKKEIAKTGGFPVSGFQKLQMVCVINSSLNFVSIQFNEVYTVKAYGFDVSTTLNITETFHSFGAVTQIPNSENLP